MTAPQTDYRYVLKIEAENERLRAALSSIKDRAKQAEVFHERLGTEECFRDIFLDARAALEPSLNETEASDG